MLFSDLPEFDIPSGRGSILQKKHPSRHEQGAQVFVNSRRENYDIYKIPFPEHFFKHATVLDVFYIEPPIKGRERLNGFCELLACHWFMGDYATHMGKEVFVTLGLVDLGEEGRDP